MFLTPTGYVCVSELERLSEHSYSYVMARLRKAGLKPIIQPRTPSPSAPNAHRIKGGRPMHLYPLKEALDLILD